MAVNLVNNLNQPTDQDLTNATNLATSMNDAQAVTCFHFIQQELPILRSDVGALTWHVGLFTTFEAGHIVVGWAQNGLPDKADFETKCGPYGVERRWRSQFHFGANQGESGTASEALAPSDHTWEACPE